jgi:quinoprotein glucose dehydrogenase
MNRGDIKWQIPLGEVSEMVAKGVRNTGSFWPRGGAVVTAGGLIIMGTKSDAKLHIYDKDTGKQIAEMLVPAGPEGIPSVYEVGGREYIVISARPSPEKIPVGDQQPLEPNQGSAEPKDPSKQTQGYYVYALPEASGKKK